MTSVLGRSAPSPVEPTEPGQDDVSATCQLPTPVESRALVPRKRRVPSVQDYSRAVVSAPRLLAFFVLIALSPVTSRWRECNRRSHDNLQQDLADRRMANPLDPVLSHHTSQEWQPAAVLELPNDQPHQ